MLDKMSGRERLLTVFRKKKADRVPWSPCICYYFTASVPGYTHLNDVEMFRLIGADILERHVPVYLPLIPDLLQVAAYEKKENFSTTIEKKQIRMVISRKGEKLQVIYETPVGKLKETYIFKPTSPFVPFPSEYMIKTKEDLKVFQFLVESQQYQPYFDYFREREKYIGEDGLATASGPTTPLEDMLEVRMGVENFYYLLNDYQAEVEATMELMHEVNKRIYRVIANSPAQIVFDYEDTSTTNISPSIYQKYALKLIDEYAHILHRAGKIFGTHMCGKLKGLIDLIAVGKQDAIVDVTPSTTGDVEMKEVLKKWKDKVIVGGLEPTVLVNNSTEEIKNYTRRLLASVDPGERFILGSGDAVPYGTPLESLQAITDVVRSTYE